MRRILNNLDAIIYFLVLIVPCILITALWGWFAPMDDETPVAIRVIFIALALFALAAALIIDFVQGEYVWIIVSAVIFGALLLAGLLGAVDFSQGPSRSPVVSLVAVSTVFVALVAAAEVVNNFWAYLHGKYWEEGKYLWQSRMYARALVRFLIAAVLTVFEVLWPFK